MIPSDWVYIELEHITEIHDRGRIPIKASERVSGNIPYCGANGVIDYVKSHTHDGKFAMLAEDGGFFEAGDSSSYMMEGKFWANNHVHILRGKDEQLLTEYLHYFLNNISLKPFLTGATRPKLTQTSMKRIPIPVPYPDDPDRSLTEQQRIVNVIEALLQEVREMREIQQEISDNTDKLLTAFVDEVFREGIGNGWSDKTIRQLVAEKPQYGSNQKANTDGIGVPVLRMGNIQDGELDFTDMKHADVDDNEKQKYLLNRGDIVFNRTNSAEHVGKSAIFDEGEDMIFASYLIRVVMDDKKADPEFIAYFINSSLGRKYIDSQYIRAIGQVNVNAQKMQDMSVPIPDTIEEQQRIVARLNQIREEVKEMKKMNANEMERIDQLEQSILAQAFRGEL